MRRGELTFDAKLNILAQILDALAHTHREGVIHRDIKPSNVYVLADGSIKLVDFGLARVAEFSPLTRTGDVMGTPDYASPEQLMGTRIDHRIDIYSTGALAYEMIAGRRPFRALDPDEDSVGALILRVLSGSLPPIDVLETREFPEIDRAQFFTIEAAREKMHPAEFEFLPRLTKLLGDVATKQDNPM